MFGRALLFGYALILNCSELKRLLGVVSYRDALRHLASKAPQMDRLHLANCNQQLYLLLCSPLDIALP